MVLLPSHPPGANKPESVRGLNGLLFQNGAGAAPMYRTTDGHWERQRLGAESKTVEPETLGAEKTPEGHPDFVQSL